MQCKHEESGERRWVAAGIGLGAGGHWEIPLGHCRPGVPCLRSLRLTWANGLVAMCQSALPWVLLFTLLRPGSQPVFLGGASNRLRWSTALSQSHSPISEKSLHHPSFQVSNLQYVLDYLSLSHPCETHHSPSAVSSASEVAQR